MNALLRVAFLGAFALTACALVTTDPPDPQTIWVGCQLLIPADQGVIIPPNSKLLIGGSDCHE